MAVNVVLVSSIGKRYCVCIFIAVRGSCIIFSNAIAMSSLHALGFSLSTEIFTRWIVRVRTSLQRRQRVIYRIFIYADTHIKIQALKQFDTERNHTANLTLTDSALLVFTEKYQCIDFTLIWSVPNDNGLT